jgi:MFS family permease
VSVETDVLPVQDGADAGEQRVDRDRRNAQARPSGQRVLHWLDAHALFVAATAAVVIISLASIPTHLSQDGWLALVAGRIVAHHGIPHHDYLTVMAHGVRWTDQQWLAQLVMYGLYSLGGLSLLTVVYVLITGAAFAMAIVAARRLGGEDRHVTAMLPLGAFFYLVTAVSIRTQGFVYPLFVGTVWLLAAETRRSTRRAYLVFPMLILWANLHGSATLGAGIAALYGACLLGQGFLSQRWHGLRNPRGLTFLIGSPLCLLVTPYGTSIIRYYGATLFNPEFSKLVTEWQPVTAYMILAVPLLLLIVATIWSLGRSGRRTPAFSQIVLAVLALAAIDAVRNITWFGLAVVILLPVTITGLLAVKPPAPRRAALNVSLALASLLLVLLMVGTTLARPASWFESTYPTRAVSTVRSILARQPDAKIFADTRFSDWLVWHDPALSGHIAYDTSFENLTRKQLQTLNTLPQAPAPGQRDPLAPYSVLVLNPKNKAENRLLLARTHAHVVLRSKRVLIATKSPE